MNEHVADFSHVCLHRVTQYPNLCFAYKGYVASMYVRMDYKDKKNVNQKNSWQKLSRFSFADDPKDR